MHGCCRVPGLCWARRDVTARTTSLPMLCLPLEQNQRASAQRRVGGVLRQSRPPVGPGERVIVSVRLGEGRAPGSALGTRGGAACRMAVHRARLLPRRQKVALQGCQFGIPHHQQLDLKHRNNCYKSVTLF